MKKYLIAAVWLCCSYFAYGLTLGYFDHRYPWYENRGLAARMALMGPFGLAVSVAESYPNFHWRLKAPSVEERWEAFHKNWSSLDRECFERDYN